MDGDHLRLIPALAAARRTRSADSEAELYASLIATACDELGFRRGLVLTVEANALTPVAGDAGLAGRGTISMAPGSAEHALVRGAAGGNSCVRDVLGLGEVALGALVAGQRTAALLVVERDGPPVTPAEASAVAGLAAFAGAELESLQLRRRLQELRGRLQGLGATDAVSR